MAVKETGRDNVDSNHLAQSGLKWTW